MKKVEIHKILSNGNISGYFDEIITDIDTNDRIFRLFGLQFGLLWKKWKAIYTKVNTGKSL